jgi:AcrR family transcriptional regulator
MEKQPTEIRQAQIKKAVLEIISTEGLQQLTTRNLARRVGISEGAVFRHFTSKRDIILGIMEDVQQDLQSTLRRISTDIKDPDQRLFEFLCAHIQYLLKNKGINILLFSEATHMNDGELKSHLRAILLEQKQFVSKIIQDGIIAGRWDPELRVENVAILYMGIPITLNIELVLNPKGIETENFCQRMKGLLDRVLNRS